MNNSKKEDKSSAEEASAHSHEHVHGPNCQHDHHHHHEAIRPIIRQSPKIGRNDPCSCGSQKKYKKCCGA